MPQINILNILQGDNQATIVDKLNYNFDQILSAGGGPQGIRGLVGPTGPLGPQGYQGPQGIQGPSGSKWFVQQTAPASGGIDGSNPWDYPTLGDYWMDPDSAAQSIYIFTATGWVDTGYGLGAGSLFQKVTPINISGGATAQAIMVAGATASDQTLVLSDSSIPVYTPGGNAIDNLNFENSKLKISTKNLRTKLISFGRSDYDITPGGSAGLNSTNNPYFAWDQNYNPFGTTGAGPGFYNISFTNPRGSIGISSLGSTAESGININSTSEITASASDNIMLQTNTPNKGLFIGSSTVGAGGFVEFSNQKGSNPSNKAGAYMFANSTGLGLGLGTGEFKQDSSTSSRRLAVNGNASIAKSATGHTSDIFVGHSTSGKYDKGALFVEGQGAFGATGPTASYYPGSFSTYFSLPTTGASESLNRFPQFWVTSLDRGPVFQVKNLGTYNAKGGSVLPRTIIGDASSEFSFETGPTASKISGIYSDISQVIQINPGDGITAPISTGPVFSYQHKVASSGVTSSNEPVFAITTHVNGISYNVNSYAQKTVIQTLNSNSELHIFANSTGSSNNNTVLIGANNNTFIRIRGGETPGSTGFGTTTIGASGDSYTGYRASLSSMSNFTSADSIAKGISPRSNHSLVVTGIQTIGTSDHVSRFNPIGNDITSGFGGSSMLKIHRNLFTSTYNYNSGPMAYTGATGSYIKNHPNGLEITSYKSNIDGTFTSDNKSVAIAVGASDQIQGFENGPDINFTPVFNPTGFFVSDTGENVSIGQYIDYNTALGISGAGSDFSIKAKGNVGITGSVSVTGTFTTSTNATIGGLLSVTSGGINATGGFNFYGGRVNIYANGAGNSLNIYSSSFATPDYTFDSSGNIHNLTGTLNSSIVGVDYTVGTDQSVIKSGACWYKWTGFSTYYVNEPNASAATTKLNWMRVGSVVTVTGIVTFGTGYAMLPCVSYESPTPAGYAGAKWVTVRGIAANTSTGGLSIVTSDSTANGNTHIFKVSGAMNTSYYVNFSYQLYH